MLRDGARLIGRQRLEVRGAHIQPARLSRVVDHVEDAFFFGDDRVDGELLVSFAVVRARAAR